MCANHSEDFTEDEIRCIMLIGGYTMIKLIAMDMDGTLLNSENKILPETKEMLINVQQQGIRLVLASGRSYCKLMEYAEELQMHQYGGFLLEINGLALYDLQNDKRTVRAQMNIDQVKELFHYFRQWDVEIMAQFDDGMFDYNPPVILEEKAKYRKEHHLPDDYPWTGGAFAFLHDNRKGYPKTSYIESAEEIDREINKISVTYHPSVIDEVSACAKRDLGNQYWVGRTTEKWLEIMLPGITKGSGLETLGEMLNIKPNEMMAFGDGENDIEMLSYVSYGIAMGNALESVKEYAMDITDDNQNNGIVKAIKKYINL